MAGASVFSDMDAGTLEALRRQFIEDKLWLEKNIDELRKTYLDKFVAVKNKNIIGSSADMRKLVESLREQNIPANNIVIEYIPATDYIWVL